MIAAFEALGSRQKIREIAAKARADERTVKRVLRGEWKHNSAEERILMAMGELGIRRPLGIVKVVMPEAKEAAK